MPLKVWDGSAWKMAAQIKVWNGSSWVSTNALDNAKSAKVWNGSSWVQFHPGVQINEYPSTGSGLALYQYTAVDNGNTAYASNNITVNSNGTLYITDQSSYNFSWLLTGANSDYYAYMDAPTGDSFSSGTTGSALQLNTSRAWQLEVSNSVNNSNVFKSLSSTLRIQNSAGTDILSVAVSMDVEAQVGIPP
jgi:hypothetical protein